MAYRMDLPPVCSWNIKPVMQEQYQEVREANRNFYRAFESLKIELMEKVWLNAAGIKCIHPGWPPLFGWDDIMESWNRIFQHTNYMEFDLGDETIFVDQDLAVVSNAENLVSANMGKTASGQVQATNVYRRHDGEWLMIVHHVS